MLLLNLVRTIITLLGLLILAAVVGYYELQGWQVIMALAVTLFSIFTAGDYAEAKLIEYFNNEA